MGRARAEASPSLPATACEIPLCAGHTVPTATEGSAPCYLALPARCAIHGSIQLGVARVPHRAPQRVADALQKTRLRRTRLPHWPTHQQKSSLQEEDRPVQSAPSPREPLGAVLTRRVMSGRGLAYIHVITEGGVGTILQPALVAHIVEDARGHQGVVQHLLGRGIIQAQPPAPAEREGSQRITSGPALWTKLWQLLTEEPNSSLMSRHEEKQPAFLADMTRSLQPAPELLQHVMGTCGDLLPMVAACPQSHHPAGLAHGG